MTFQEGKSGKTNSRPISNHSARKIIGFILFLILVGLSTLGIESWIWTKDWLLKQLSVQSELVAHTSEDLSTALQTGLPFLGVELGGTTIEPTKHAYIVLSRYLKTHPYITNLAVYNLNGKMLLNTAVPYDSPLPEPPYDKTHIDDLKKILTKRGLQFGKTRLNPYTHEWDITAHYVVRTNRGTPVAIIQANIPVNLIKGKWGSMNLSPNTAIGLIRTDGFLLNRYPSDMDNKTLYNHRFDGGLIQAIRKNPNRHEGNYIGRVQVDNTHRIGAYTRLLGQNVVAFVSLPETYVWSVWQKQALPSLIIGLFSLAVLAVFLSRYLARERSHARTLISERDHQAWIARHDALTNLPNRTALEERLIEAQARAERHNTLLAVCLFDLDDFKPINDRFGHEAGDRVLRHVGKIFTRNIRRSDYVVRLGGDEFVLLFEDLSGLGTLLELLTRLETQLGQLYELSESEKVSIAGTMGITIYPFDEAEGDVLLRHADRALYQGKSTKHRRKNFWTLYENQWAENWYQSQARKKMNEGELIVHYQPVLDLRSRTITGVEALVRLYDPKTKTLLHPGQFLHDITLPEDCYYLTRHVLKQVDDDAQVWANAGLETLNVSVNLPPIFLRQKELHQQLLDDIEKLKTPADRITFEVLETEGGFTLDCANHLMMDFKNRGFKFALDDIGSAYSTLLRLKKLPVDCVKLDQDFVRELSSKPEDLIFVDALYDIADVLQIDFIAEGVETPSILDALIAMGIPKAQGYAIARPLPASEFLEWLHQYTPPPDKPYTLLGLYATHRKRDYFIHSLLTKNSDLLKFPSELATLEEIDVLRLLQQLGYGDTGLHDAYERYRETLSKIIDSHSVNKNMVIDFKTASEAFDKLLERAIKT